MWARASNTSASVMVIMLLCASSSCVAQRRPLPAGGADAADLCPVPATMVAASGWSEFHGRNLPFTIRLPSGSKDLWAEHPDIHQAWEVDLDHDPWLIVYARPTEFQDELDPYGEALGEGVTRHQVIQHGPCRERIGDRDATVWVGEWVTRGVHASLPYQVVVAWDLDSGKKLYVLGQARSATARDRALAALRTVRFK